MEEFCGVQKGARTNDSTMIRVIRICRKCGAKIFSDAPEGLCAKCVLKAAFGVLTAPSVVGGGDLGCVDESSSGEPNAGGQHRKNAIRAAELLGELGDYELLEEIGRG